jgi:hypothetical protein
VGAGLGAAGSGFDSARETIAAAAVVNEARRCMRSPVTRV